MRSLFWFSLILGGGFLALSMFSDVLDLDVDELDGDSGHGDSGHGDAAKILSLRNLTYFLFGFGAVGVGLDWLWRGERVLLAAAIAVPVGAASALLASLAFAWVRRNEAGEREAEDSFVGLRGRITLPIAPDHAGRVMVRRGEREFELRARAFEADAGGADGWMDVVVVDMDAGTALVTPADSPLT